MVTTVRALQSNFDTSFTGGTRVTANVMSDIGPFMDALDRQDTPFLDDCTKRGTVNQRKHEWGIHGVTPRGSTVGTGGITNVATTLPVATGHGSRFQQGHVLRIVHASDGSYEHVWVTADPSGDNLTVKRAQGGTTAAAGTAGDKIIIVGIALAQAADFPLSPVSRGRRYYNWVQEFAKHIEMSEQNRRTPDYENPSGDWLDRDMLQLGKDIHKDLEMALLLGRRQDGDPNPSAPIGSMLGGLEQFAELSGNVYNIGGASTKVSIEAIETAAIDLNLAYGTQAGKKLLMSIKTKQIFNRLLHPSKFAVDTGAITANSASLTWDTVKLETGTYKFSSSLNVPDGKIFIYDPAWLSYKPFVGLDWKEKDISASTKGNYSWRGISGTFTFEAEGVPAMAVIYNFDTTLADYPKFGTAS